FLPVRVVSRHLRHLFQQALRDQHPALYAQVPSQVWRQDLVVHCVRWGRDDRNVLEYLARYVFRIAITERRILAMDDRTVTFQYKDRKAHRQRTCRITGVEFMRRFLQHVLPKGFHKVRYYGLWHPQRRELADRVRQLLTRQAPVPLLPLEEDAPASPMLGQPFRPTCPHCGCSELRWVGRIPRPPIRGP
ncbi:MAG: transposase, partial [Phycisphaerae bacterium]|nr:transposase [Phycisphaerae bacterium]